MSLTRRSFMQSLLAAGGAMLPAGAALARSAPSNRVTLGFIGVGGMGRQNVGGFLRAGGCQVLAVCDVDGHHAAITRAAVDGFYREALDAGTYDGCAVYRDFRALIDRDDIDAVVISTPDHWHAIPAIEAMKAGKDVYCEKPMALTIAEGQAMVAAAGRHGRVFQLGTQNRSHPVVRHVCELVRNGVVGAVRTVRVGLPWGAHIPVQPVMPVPDNFDYNMWLGPAPWEPYTEKRCHVSFRGILDYSGGGVTDLGTHYIDVMHWGCGLEHTGPVRVEGEGHFYRNALSDVAGQCRFTLEYANGVVADCSTEHPLGCRFEGEDGWIYLPLGFPGPETSPGDKTPSASDPRLLQVRLGLNDLRLRESLNHHGTFVDCVGSRAETAAPVEAGHRSTSACHLANIAMRLGRPLLWNPETERCTDDGANAMLSRAMRAPWRIT